MVGAAVAVVAAWTEAAGFFGGVVTAPMMMSNTKTVTMGAAIRAHLG